MSFPTTYQACEKLAHTRKRKLANNTYLEVHDGSYGIRLHDTEVVTFYADRTVLNSGGWRTVTTKDRMNQALVDHTIFSDKGVWYVAKRPYSGEHEAVAYNDGFTIHSDGTTTGQGNDPKAALKERKRLNKFCKDYMKAFAKGEVPAPSGGDCWYCYMTVAKGPDKGKGWGESIRGTQHILAHVKDSYFVPSLLIRAIERFPVSQVAEYFLHARWNTNIKETFMGDIAMEQLGKSLRRYVNEQMGYQV